MNPTAVSPQVRDATARAIHLLGSASEQLLTLHHSAEDPRDRDDLHHLALDAFMSAGCAWNLLPADRVIDASVTSTTDPLSQISEAHDLLLENTTAMDPAEVLSMVLGVGSIRQQLRHYELRHRVERH